VVDTASTNINPIRLNADNQSTIELALNPVNYSRTKYSELLLGSEASIRNVRAGNHLCQYVSYGS